MEITKIGMSNFPCKGMHQKSLPDGINLQEGIDMCQATWKKIDGSLWVQYPRQKEQKMQMYDTLGTYMLFCMTPEPLSGSKPGDTGKSCIINTEELHINNGQY